MFRIVKLLVVIILIFISTPSHGLQIFLNAWQGIYPQSNSDDIAGTGCQVCHVNADGNEPWNDYGWTIRGIYNANGFDIIEAINIAADIDSDGDPQSVSSEDEIIRSFQPGWTEGPNNTHHFVSGSQTTGQSPPNLPNSTELDFPNDSVSNPIANVGNGSIAIQLNEVAAGFDAPLKAVTAPGIQGSIFVVEQTGDIVRVELSNGAKSKFADVSNDLILGGERGLLGLAFHPDFATNGLFYTYQSEPRRASQDLLVDYSTINNPNHRSMITEYQASDPTCNSFINKTKTLLIIDQPQSNHNGGDLAFGPDGFLYISIGDGGGAHDIGNGHGVLGNGRDNTNPLGSILRIDVDGSNSANGRYGIPNDNPFIANGDIGVDEIFAYGFRNPFRISFDSMTGDLYAGDVGQGDIEEIDRVVNGGNYGWNWKEGTFFFYHSLATSNYVSNTAPPGLPNDLIDPIAEYDHDDGISVTGGYVYRGSQVPVLQGHYVFADFSRRLFYLDSNDTILEFQGSGVAENVTSFGVDVDKELYVVTNDFGNLNGSGGKLYKISALGDNNNPFPNAGEESAQCPASDELCVPIKATNGNIALICL